MYDQIVGQILIFGGLAIFLLTLLLLVYRDTKAEQRQQAQIEDLFEGSVPTRTMKDDWA